MLCQAWSTEDWQREYLIRAAFQAVFPDYDSSPSSLGEKEIAFLAFSSTLIRISVLALVLRLPLPLLVR